MVMIYSMIAMVSLLAIASVAVDWGRAQLAKTELVGASDAAARAGAASLATSPANAYDAAIWTASKNFVDGTSLVLKTTDIEIGSWNTASKSFVKLEGGDQFTGNAVRISSAREASRSSAVPLAFASVFGRKSLDLHYESIAMMIRGFNVDQPVQATANPFLAGMPAGSIASVANPHNNPDFAGSPADPKQSPQTVSIPLTEGMVLTFDSIDGLARHDPGLTDFSPDGQLSDIGHNTAGSENGIADVTAPINALVGVFLTDDQPSLTKAPTSLDFSSDASRDFQTLKPQVKQIFFIGDGVDSKGQRQEFVVPKGATRLYVATWDFYEWNNNSGSRTVKVNRPQQIVIVK